LEHRPAALLIAPETPFPMSGGGAIRTASLVHYLALHYDTDLIVFRQPGAPDPAGTIPKGLVRSVSVIDLPPNGRSLPAKLLRNASRVARSVPPLMDRFSGFGAAIDRAVAGRRYAIGIIEHFWCAPYLEQIAAACGRTFLDLHNVESVLHARCVEAEAGAAALGHRIFHKVSLELERTWLPQFSEVLTTSANDDEQVRAIAPLARTSVYPNAIRFEPRPAAGCDEAVVFSGNMEYHPNRAAVRYFRTRIWPALRDRWPGLVWRLVGKNPEAVREWTGGDSRIQVTGPVDDAIANLAAARVAVVPVLAGSGTRFKILEAWSAGVPVVSTTIGAEGLGATPGEHLLIADTSGDFCDAVTRLLAAEDACARIAAAARLLLEKEFTWETAWRKLTF
jgi:polysaccharide biosynthesis protein PslH